MIKEYLLIYETETSEPVFGGGIYEMEVTTTIHEITLKGKNLVDVVNYAYDMLELEKIIEVVEVR